MPREKKKRTTTPRPRDSADGDETARHDQTHELLLQARAGDAAAFGQLVQLFMRSVYALSYRFMGNHDDADDIAQETFVRAYQALHRYDAQYRFYTWLRTIATRLALNELQKRRRRKTGGGEDFEAATEQTASNAPDPHEHLEGQEARQILETAFAGLPDKFRSVLALRTYEQMSYDEIAGSLDIPIGTVMSRLSRARRMLRDALEASDRVEGKT